MVFTKDQMLIQLTRDWRRTAFQSAFDTKPYSKQVRIVLPTFGATKLDNKDWDVIGVSQPFPTTLSCVHNRGAGSRLQVQLTCADMC
jgi:hypothetical protein